MRSRYFKKFLNNPNLEAQAYRNLMLIEGPISKGGLLCNHWYVDPDSEAVDTPESLAISTTSRDTLSTAMRFGTHVIEMEIPAKRLITRWEEQGMIDYSILYLINASEVKMIYEVDRTDYFSPQLKPITNIHHSKIF